MDVLICVSNIKNDISCYSNTMSDIKMPNIESPCEDLDVGLGLPYNQSNIYTKLFVMFDTTFFQPQLRAT